MYWKGDDNKDGKRQFDAIPKLLLLVILCQAEPRDQQEREWDEKTRMLVAMETTYN